MKAVLAACGILFSASLVAAEDVTLTSRDGSLVVTGNNARFDGEFFRLDTVYGPLTVDAAGVTCEGPGCPPPEAYVSEMVISGTAIAGETMLPAMIAAFAGRSGRTVLEIEDTYQFDLSGVDGGPVEARFRLIRSNTDEGFADLLANEAGAVLAMREISTAEERRLVEAGQGTLSDADHSRVIALDALVAVVASSNPIGSITPAMLARVFAGEITSWEALGGPDVAIELHAAVENGDLARAFQRQVLAGSNATLSEGATLHADGVSVSKAVQDDPNAIGISYLSMIGDARAVPLLGSCGHLARPEADALRSGDYPLVAPLYLYKPAQRLPASIRGFLKFVESLPAQAVVRRAGLTDLIPDRVGLEAQGQRLARAITGTEVGLSELRRLVAAMDGSERLTLTFRFRNGSTRLDARSQSNVTLLADLIGRGDFDGETLVFAGFTDARGSAAENRRLSRLRAEAILSAVVEASPPQKRDRVSFATDGFGEAMPMACDEDDWGRRLNRRVEVWVKPGSE